MNLEVEWYLTNEKLPRHMERVIVSIAGKQFNATFDAERKQMILQTVPHTTYCAITNSIGWKRV